jgi:hypothetical protein
VLRCWSARQAGMHASRQAAASTIQMLSRGT